MHMDQCERQAELKIKEEKVESWTREVKKAEWWRIDNEGRLPVGLRARWRSWSLAKGLKAEGKNGVWQKTGATSHAAVPLNCSPARLCLKWRKHVNLQNFREQRVQTKNEPLLTGEKLNPCKFYIQKGGWCSRFIDIGAMVLV